MSLLAASLLLAPVASNAAADPVRADTARESQGMQWHFRVGLGVTSYGPAAEAGLGWSMQGNILEFRYIGTREFGFNVEPGIYPPPPDPWLGEFGLLYGRSFRIRDVIFSAAAGIGIVNGIAAGDLIPGQGYEQVNVSGVSLPLEATVRADFGFWGFGFSGVGDLNRTRFLGGFLLQIYFGG